MSATQQDVMLAAQVAYDTTASFFSLPSIAQQVAAVQTLLDTANTTIKARDAAIAVLTGQVGTARADATAAVAAAQKTVTDLGG